MDLVTNTEPTLLDFCTTNQSKAITATNESRAKHGRLTLSLLFRVFATVYRTTNQIKA